MQGTIECLNSCLTSKEGRKRGGREEGAFSCMATRSTLNLLFWVRVLWDGTWVHCTSTFFGYSISLEIVVMDGYTDRRPLTDTMCCCSSRLVYRACSIRNTLRCFRHTCKSVLSIHPKSTGQKKIARATQQSNERQHAPHRLTPHTARYWKTLTLLWHCTGDGISAFI